MYDDESKHVGIITRIRNMPIRNKIIGIIAVCVLFICVFVFFAHWYTTMLPYSQANSLFEKKEYKSAIKKLEPLAKKDYKDSKQLSKYISATEAFEKGEKEVSVIDRQLDYNTASSLFESLGKYKDSQEYVSYISGVSGVQSYVNTISLSSFSSYAEKFKKAGDIKNSDLLEDFFQALADKKYDDAIKAANEYKKTKETLLNNAVLSYIATLGYYNTDVSISDGEDMNNTLGLLSVGINTEPKFLTQISTKNDGKDVKSFKINGLGKKPKGKVLVIYGYFPYKGSDTHEFKISYTALAGKELFPQSVEEVRYIIKLYKKENFKTWFTSGAHQVPGVTQYMYAEIYDTQKNKVIGKSKIKNGPALKTSYRYPSVPTSIYPTWNDINKIEKSLVNQMLKDIPKK